MWGTAFGFLLFRARNLGEQNTVVRWDRRTERTLSSATPPHPLREKKKKEPGLAPVAQAVNAHPTPPRYGLAAIPSGA